MPLDRLVGLLACPTCRGSLLNEPATATLTCPSCEATYVVAEGVPVMLAEASRVLLASGQEADPTAGRPQRWWGIWFGKFVRAATPGGPCYDPDQETRVRRMIRHLGDGAAILDLGSGGRSWGPTVITMDVDRFPNVGLVGDGHRLPFADDALDGVICTGVLEHVNDAEAVTREIWRVTRPSGLVYVAVPFMQGYHPASGTHQDFRRLTHVGLQELLSAFERLDSGVSGGPSSSVAWILCEYFALLFFDGGRGYTLAYMVAGWLTWWIRYLDRFLARREKAHRIACGFYILGRKPLTPSHGDA
ncbi:MAG: methyltransferase domain-containing protein [Candidatus Methylomirabilales bacterium]